MVIRQHFRAALFVNNPLGALERLLHDDTHLRGWGEPALTDHRLLTVRGFDAASNRFLYNVNPRFGSLSSVTRAPFRVTLDMRLDIGPNRESESMRVYMRRARQASGGAALATDLKRELVGLQMGYGAHAFEPLARFAEQLGLDSLQADSIVGLVDRYSTATDSIYTELAQYLAARPGTAGDKRTRRYWHQAIAESIRKKYALALELRALLTPTQIAWLRAEGESPWIDYTPEWLEHELRQPMDPH